MSAYDRAAATLILCILAVFGALTLGLWLGIHIQQGICR